MAALRSARAPASSSSIQQSPAFEIVRQNAADGFRPAYWFFLLGDEGVKAREFGRRHAHPNERIDSSRRRTPSFLCYHSLLPRHRNYDNTKASRAEARD